MPSSTAPRMIGARSASNVSNTNRLSLNCPSNIPQHPSPWSVKALQPLLTSQRKSISIPIIAEQAHPNAIAWQIDVAIGLHHSSQYSRMISSCNEHMFAIDGAPVPEVANPVPGWPGVGQIIGFISLKLLWEHPFALFGHKLLPPHNCQTSLFAQFVACRQGQRCGSRPTLAGYRYGYSSHR